MCAHSAMMMDKGLMDMIICFGVILWTVLVSLLVLLRLDKIIKLLEKK